jgi:hypothetical protein
MKKNTEYITEHEQVLAWQLILSRYKENKQIKTWFNKHYHATHFTDNIFNFIESNINKDYFELLFELKSKFFLSQNKCNCKHSKIYDLSKYDANGNCNTCELKIKKIKQHGF